MKQLKTQMDLDHIRTATTSWIRSVVAASRTRRQGLVIALLLAVPVIAWTPTLGLLFWARLRLLTDLPRTAMATEDPQVVAIAPPTAFPKGPVVGFDTASGRDPLRRMSYDSSKTTSEAPISELGINTSVEESENGSWNTVRRQEVEGIVNRLRLQGLITGRAIAIIDGRTYRIGEQIEIEATEGELLTLRSVGRNSVVVEVDGVEFVLRLAGGGASGSLDRIKAGGASS